MALGQSSLTRSLPVSFDGLRPHLIRPDQTPNIARLQRMGVTLSRHHYLFKRDSYRVPRLVTSTTTVSIAIPAPDTHRNDNLSRRGMEWPRHASAARAFEAAR